LGSTRKKQCNGKIQEDTRKYKKIQENTRRYKKPQDHTTTTTTATTTTNRTCKLTEKGFEIAWNISPYQDPCVH
jgi:hypothetical protein